MKAAGWRQLPLLKSLEFSVVDSKDCSYIVLGEGGAICADAWQKEAGCRAGSSN